MFTSEASRVTLSVNTAVIVRACQRATSSRCAVHIGTAERKVRAIALLAHRLCLRTDVCLLATTLRTVSLDRQFKQYRWCNGEHWSHSLLWLHHQQANTRAGQVTMANPNQALWEKGDFTAIAESMRKAGEALVKRIGVKPGMKVLDLGCGDGESRDAQRTRVDQQHTHAPCGCDAACRGLDPLTRACACVFDSKTFLTHVRAAPSPPTPALSNRNNGPSRCTRGRL